MKLNAKRLAERVARARMAVTAGPAIRYCLGQGGLDPHASLPSTDGLCDCSGFVAWCLWLSRDQRGKHGMWLSSTDICRDALGAQRVFVALAEPVPGAVIAYPDRRAGSRHREGHVGIVTTVSRLEGVDCSAGMDGIRERSFAFFRRKRDAVACVLREDLEV